MLTAAHSTAYIGLGANLGDRAGNLLIAISAMLEAGLVIARLSHIYETEAVETFPQPPFLNMVAEVKSDLRPDELMLLLLQIESSLGRTRDTEKGPRNIDLDLLLVGEQILNTETLTLPHPRLPHRRFVLVPLAELAPSLVHPELNKTISELLVTVADHSEVRRWLP